MAGLKSSEEAMKVHLIAEIKILKEKTTTLRNKICKDRIKSRRVEGELRDLK